MEEAFVVLESTPNDAETLKAVFRAAHTLKGSVSNFGAAATVEAALAIEMFHNVTLIVDDLVDGSPTRRDKLTLHAKYGPLTAWMVAGRRWMWFGVLMT